VVVVVVEWGLSGIKRRLSSWLRQDSMKIIQCPRRSAPKSRIFAGGRWLVGGERRTADGAGTGDRAATRRRINFSPTRRCVFWLTRFSRANTKFKDAKENEKDS
jgi:hypothetical protein